MKQKSKKAASKRFHFSSTGKAQHRAVRQAHFNARATGNETRKKHPDRNVDASDYGRLREVLPYN
ncbi:MAG: 50S ribosomal protein L35 [Candidatus Andersenbacteria bacterium]|nr:50S ribosomal protein L35 [bacterium]MDZ4225252.1 50S ribosomal protein L35 [Candidatus Andersenbacteria bacterium]